MKRLSVGLGVAVLVTWGSMISCEKEAIRPNYSDNHLKSDQPSPPVDVIYQVSEICGEITSKRLMVGKSETAGLVYFYNDSKFLYVDAHERGGYAMEDAFLFVGDREDIPLTMNGDLATSEFNYKVNSRELHSVIRFKVPLQELKGKFAVSLMIRVQKANGAADQQKLRDAWAEGRQYSLNDFGKVFTLSKGICFVNDHTSFNE